MQNVSSMSDQIVFLNVAMVKYLKLCPTQSKISKSPLQFFSQIKKSDFEHFC